MTPRIPRIVIFLLPICFASIATGGDHFSTDDAPATKFGVHEITLKSHGGADANSFDQIVSVRFTPPSGEPNAKTVWAFFDGEGTWRARVYLSEIGEWQWNSTCASDVSMDGKSGSFTAVDSKLRGRLLIHPKNPRQWMTEDGHWFLNLNDTAYFLLCQRDANGNLVSDDDAMQYVADDVERGITSVRCFVANGASGFSESPQQWEDWYFPEKTHDQLRLNNLQLADHRLRLLLERFPDVAVQLILFPLEGYNRDEHFWTALTAIQRERLLRNLVARYAAYPQVFWLTTNDAHYGPKFPNSNAMAREVGEFLMKHDPWQHPRSTGHARRIPFYFGSEPWATYVHIEHAHDLNAKEYGKYHSFAKPVFLGEDRYEQDHPARIDPLYMRCWQRRLFWTWLFSGGSTNYGGRWFAVHPYSTTGNRAIEYRARPNTIFDQQLTGLDSVRPIRDYFDARNIELSDFEPDQSLIANLDGAADVAAPKLMRRGQVEFLIYHPHAAADGQAARPNEAATAQFRIDLRGASGAFIVEWYLAEDGQSQAGGELTAGKQCELTAPWMGADVVVRILKKPPS